MLTTYDLLKLCANFEKLAQFTSLDKKLEKKPEPPYRGYYGREPEQLSFQRHDPRTWETINKEFPIPRTPEEIAEEQRKKQEESGVEEEEEEEEEEAYDPAHHFQLPEVEPYHIEPRKLTPEEWEETRHRYYQNEGDIAKSTDEIRTEILQQYNDLKNHFALFFEKYKEANQRAAEKVELNVDNLSLLETIQHLSDYCISKIRTSGGRLFGADLSSGSSPLLKFLHKDFNIFNVTDANYRWYLDQFNSVKREIKETIASYEKLKRLELQVIKNVKPAVQVFLSDQNNIDLLNWTDKNNPDAKKQIVKEIKEALYERRWSRRSKWDRERSDFSLNDLPALRSFKEVYEKLSKTFTHKIKQKIRGKGEDHVKAIVKQQIDPILSTYLNQFDWLKEYSLFSDEKAKALNYNSQKNLKEINEGNIEEIWAKLKNDLKTMLGLDINSVEQYLKMVASKREIIKKTTDVEMVKEKYDVPTVVNNFRIGLINKLIGFFRNLHHANDIMSKVFNKLDLHPSDLIGKEIGIIIPDEEINQIIKKELREDIIDLIPSINYRQPVDYWIHANYTKEVPGLLDIKEMLNDSGSVNFKSVLDTLKAEFPEFPDSLLTMFIKYMFREDKLDLMKLIKDNKEGFSLMIKLLAKFNKLEINNLVKRMPSVVEVGRLLRKMSSDLPEKIFTPDIIEDVLLKSIRNLDTISSDIKNMETITSIIHNEGSNLSPEIALALFRNINVSSIDKVAIIKKLYKAVISIANVGGIKELKKQHGPLIQELVKSRLISKDIFKNMQFLLDVFTTNQPISPSTANFSDIFRITSEIETDLDAIMMAETYKKFFEDYEYKSPALFKLDYKINDRVRFRVLKDKDPRHLRVGIETDCCQRIGGVGETAAIDSFVNPLAGVLLLEWLNNDGKWVLVAQSYFHYVPEDNGYILDNVETNRKTLHESKLDLPKVYAWYGNKIGKKLKMKYFLAGKGYSDLETHYFKTHSMDDDPRSFSDKALTERNTDHYSDYDEENSANLMQAKFKLKELDPKTWGTIPTEEVENKIANSLTNIRRTILRAYAIAV